MSQNIWPLAITLRRQFLFRFLRMLLLFCWLFRHWWVDKTGPRQVYHHADYCTYELVKIILTVHKNWRINILLSLFKALTQGVARLKLLWFYSCVCMHRIDRLNICNLVCWTLILNRHTHEIRHHFPKMKENLVTDRKPRI